MRKVAIPIGSAPMTTGCAFRKHGRNAGLRHVPLPGRGPGEGRTLHDPAERPEAVPRGRAARAPDAVPTVARPSQSAAAAGGVTGNPVGADASKGGPDRDRHGGCLAVPVTLGPAAGDGPSGGPDTEGFPGLASRARPSSPPADTGRARDGQARGKGAASGVTPPGPRGGITPHPAGAPPPGRCHVVPPAACPPVRGCRCHAGVRAGRRAQCWSIRVTRRGERRTSQAPARPTTAPAATSVG